MYSYTDPKSQAKPKQYQDKTLYNIKIQTYSSTNLMLISTKELMKSSLKSDSHISDIRTQSKCHFTPDYQLFLNRNLCLILKSNNQLFWSAHRHHEYGNSTENVKLFPAGDPPHSWLIVISKQNLSPLITKIWLRIIQLHSFINLLFKKNFIYTIWSIIILLFFKFPSSRGLGRNPLKV